ncbi:hypothetical protein PENARI_c006G07754 [Penicillium arizonense]|uniref:ABM domain-containing protein n=1 Tax=Penicillium arizonense TaxID=1835702 RepID=A0A1F5LLK7_PENAI|nr:hypothetical protein PENARI_c006G07754 [Penicillium arizonense]OGE54094.1 hypothetical protein PENARI_c006G07754 [Penicillium arizonense]
MSEINVTAVITPKPENFAEVAALVSAVTKQVQEHEPDTLLYYAFHIEKTNEIVVVERYKHQAAVQAHMKAPYFREFAGKLPALLAKPTELKAGGFLGGWRGVSRL